MYVKVLIWIYDHLIVKTLQAEAAAAAGETSFRFFMIAVQRCASSVAILQQVIHSKIDTDLITL